VILQFSLSIDYHARIWRNLTPSGVSLGTRIVFMRLASYPKAYKKCLGIDPAYRSPSFGIVVVQFVDGQLQILRAEEYKRPDFNEMLQKVWDLLVKHSVRKVMIDGANLSFIKSLKIQWGERPDYENVKKSTTNT
jgi:hypothetical protein